jgi:aldose 1-epimerase
MIGTLSTILLETTAMRVTIVPDFGAMVQSIQVHGKKWVEILDTETAEAEILRNKWFKGAKLIPFPNRIKKGTYQFLGENHLEINHQPHAIHGLIYNKKFIIESKTRRTATLSYHLRASNGYPFDIKVTIRYAIDKNGFSCKTHIKNTGLVEAPIGDGWHPYFLCSDESTISFPSSREIMVEGTMIPVGSRKNISFNTAQRLAGLKLDTGFILHQNHTNETVLKSADREVIVWQDKSYPFVQVFIPPSRTSIAIEPMSCWANAFNNKKGLVVLRPGENWAGEYGVSVNL